MSAEPSPRLLTRAREAAAAMIRGELVGDPEVVRCLLRALERAFGHPGPGATAPQGGKRFAAKTPVMCACGVRPMRAPLPFTKELQNCAECCVEARERTRLGLAGVDTRGTSIARRGILRR